MLKGRESLIRLVGKHRRCLPNRQSLLSCPTQSSLNLRADENGKIVSIDNVEGSSNQEEQGNTENSAVGVVDERVTCPVCGNKVSGQSNIINSHLDVCLSRGTKRKLTQRTLLELNFCPDLKVQTRACYSKELGNDLFHAACDDSDVHHVVHGLSDISAVEESDDEVCGSLLNLMDDMQNLVGMCGNPIVKDTIDANVDDRSWALKNEGPDGETTVTMDDISGVILEAFIVGRKFSDEKELDLGA